MYIINPDTNEKVLVTVDEGPLPYTVELTFGSSYSIVMSTEDASKLGVALAQTGVQP
jgi:hypothetical protein